MVEFRPAGLGVWFGLVLGPSFLSPPSVCSSLPSTMTWAPCPHGVRTRGEKNSSFACQLQSTCKNLSRVDLDLPEGLLVGLGCAATSQDSPLDFRQAQNAAERSEVASPHRWSLLLPTSASVAQEVHEPSTRIQCPFFSTSTDAVWAWCPGHR